MSSMKNARELLLSLEKGGLSKSIPLFDKKHGFLNIRVFRSCISKASKELRLKSVTRVINSELHVWLV